jgi:hypothetical protein
MHHPLKVGHCKALISEGCPRPAPKSGITHMVVLATKRLQKCALVVHVCCCGIGSTLVVSAGHRYSVAVTTYGVVVTCAWRLSLASVRCMRSLRPRTPKCIHNQHARAHRRQSITPQLRHWPNHHTLQPYLSPHPKRRSNLSLLRWMQTSEEVRSCGGVARLQRHGVAANNSCVPCRPSHQATHARTYTRKPRKHTASYTELWLQNAARLFRGAVT